MWSVTSQAPIVFFDIANELASVRVSGTADAVRELVAYPEIPERLKQLRDAGARLGIRAYIGRIPPGDVLDALRRAGLFDYLDPDLLRFEREDSRTPSGIAPSPLHEAEHDGATAPRVLFVSADAGERARARAGGMLVAPHPALAEAVLFGDSPLEFLEIHVPPGLVHSGWRTLLGELPVAPLHVSTDLEDAESPVVYAVADLATAERLAEAGFRVSPLGNTGEPVASDLYLVAENGADTEESSPSPRDGRSASNGSVPEGFGNVLAITREGLLVAVPAGEFERFQVGGSPDIRSRRLDPSAALLQAAPPLGPSPFPGSPADGSGAGVLSGEEIRMIRGMVRHRDVRRDVDRYSGVAPLRRGVTIVSRNIMHLHNRESVYALAGDLAKLGGERLEVRLHPFKRYGVQLANVEAALPRSGLDGIVVIGAHLDSTARLTDQNDPVYRPERDPAPGADDNASGIAGVLCAARALLRLSHTGVKHREIRFVFFNGEEYGVSGSNAYALDRRQMCDNIVAVFNMDMIGHDAVPPSSYEVHAGGEGEALVLAHSIDLARLVDAVAREVCKEKLVAQLDLGKDRPDPAATFSDHSSFQTAGYPACLISEDFYEDLGANPPAPDRAPGYHRRTDTVVHAPYAADIARAVTAAAWVAATLR